MQIKNDYLIINGQKFLDVDFDQGDILYYDSLKKLHVGQLIRTKGRDQIEWCDGSFWERVPEEKMKPKEENWVSFLELFSFLIQRWFSEAERG